MLQYRRELDQQMWCSPWYLFNSILKPPSYEILSEWCPPNYVWTNLMVVSYQNETLCICFILEESPKVALVIDITEPLADVRSWDGEWLDYIVWPDHAVILGHFLARPLSHCLEGKKSVTINFRPFYLTEPSEILAVLIEMLFLEHLGFIQPEDIFRWIDHKVIFFIQKAKKLDNAN